VGVILATSVGEDELLSIEWLEKYLVHRKCCGSVDAVIVIVTAIYHLGQRAVSPTSESLS
jgi:hypothetical protein